VEQAFMPAEALISDPALAAEVNETHQLYYRKSAGEYLFLKR
jgi:hypothetical protein